MKYRSFKPVLFYLGISLLLLNAIPLSKQEKNSLMEDLGESSENTKKDVLAEFLAKILLVYFSNFFLGIVENIIASPCFYGSMSCV
jgi:membrane-anchored glycerophosphoryl diester phosphodiesterase (GDPDase)